MSTIYSCCALQAKRLLLDKPKMDESGVSLVVVGVGGSCCWRVLTEAVLQTLQMACCSDISSRRPDVRYCVRPAAARTVNRCQMCTALYATWPRPWSREACAALCRDARVGNQILQQPGISQGKPLLRPRYEHLQRRWRSQERSPFNLCQSCHCQGTPGTLLWNMCQVSVVRAGTDPVLPAEHIQTGRGHVARSDKEVRIIRLCDCSMTNSHPVRSLRLLSWCSYDASLLKPPRNDMAFQQVSCLVLGCRSCNHEPMSARMCSASEDMPVFDLKSSGMVNKWHLQGGLFVFDKDRNLVYGHCDQGTADHAPQDQVMQACCSP